MKNIKKELKKRISELEQLIKQKRKALENAPEGGLRINATEKRTQYYLITERGDSNGTYLPARQAPLARKLAQRDYDTQVVKTAEAERDAIRGFLLSYPKTPAEELYEGLKPQRQALVRPIREADAIYAQKWKEADYTKKEMPQNGAELYTERGERMRSKSEVMIANLLDQNELPYRYECQINLKGFGTIYPDFIVLDPRTRKEIVWEHFGMVDDPEYAEHMVNKLLLYQKNGYIYGDQLIATFESAQRPLDLRAVKQIIMKLRGV